MQPGRTLILCDGGALSLLACGAAREAVAAGAAREAATVLAFPGFVKESRVRMEAVERQCDLFGLSLLGVTVAPGIAGMTPGEIESHELLTAVYLAAKNGYEQVVWPASGAIADNLSLDRIAEITDRAVLVGRLTAIDSAHHGVPSIRIEAPYVDFTDRQVADLILDLDLPVEACWWWRAESSGEADRERRRWISALEAIGWSGAVSRRPG